MTRIGRRVERLQDLMAEAAHAALHAAAVDRPDAIVIAVMNPEEFLGDGNFASTWPRTSVAECGHAHRDGDVVGRGGVVRGFAEVAAGLHRHVLVVGGEKMTHLSTPRVSEIIGRSIDPTSGPTARPCRPCGLITRALLGRHGVGRT
jgi:acetyl-CoA C-acetyltransferase